VVLVCMEGLRTLRERAGDSRAPRVTRLDRDLLNGIQYRAIVGVDVQPGLGWTWMVVVERKKKGRILVASTHRLSMTRSPSAVPVHTNHVTVRYMLLSIDRR
jgi:hypothetical protein